MYKLRLNIGINILEMSPKDKIVDTLNEGGIPVLLMHDSQDKYTESRVFVVREIQHFVKMEGKIYEVYEKPPGRAGDTRD